MAMHLRRASATFASFDEGCEVVLPKRGKVRAVAHFAGGAFVGAAPKEAYGPLLRKLSDAGIACIAAPYAVSFDHEERASKVRAMTSKKHSELTRLGRWHADVPAFALGHSNGALLHAISACEANESFTKMDGYVFVSFNSRPLEEAVPVPGLLDTFPSLLRFAMEATRPTLDASLPLPFSQLESVAREVAYGGATFKPTPEECRERIRLSFPKEVETLLIGFQEDAIDQTDDLLDALERRRGTSKTKRLLLRGTHLTPIAQEANWKIGNSYTPLDAIGQATQHVALADLRALVDEIVEWTERCILL